ncbi:hypothetical protein, partial [uncultured Corynebacterium sp.]|uniref:hypothetical protein n=1 Tax=uncultured Corynebacterium sp. TaxID=159447 RepID=UPI00259A24F4
MFFPNGSNGTGSNGCGNVGVVVDEGVGSGLPEGSQSGSSDSGSVEGTVVLPLSLGVGSEGSDGSDGSDGLGDSDSDGLHVGVVVLVVSVVEEAGVSEVVVTSVDVVDEGEDGSGSSSGSGSGSSVSGSVVVTVVSPSSLGVVSEGS